MNEEHVDHVTSKQTCRQMSLVKGSVWKALLVDAHHAPPNALGPGNRAQWMFHPRLMQSSEFPALRLRQISRGRDRAHDFWGLPRMEAGGMGKSLSVRMNMHSSTPAEVSSHALCDFSPAASRQDSHADEHLSGTDGPFATSVACELHVLWDPRAHQALCRTDTVRIRPVDPEST